VPRLVPSEGEVSRGSQIVWGRRSLVSRVTKAAPLTALNLLTFATSPRSEKLTFRFSPSSPIGEGPAEEKQRTSKLLDLLTFKTWQWIRHEEGGDR
jgi:hypothetical protein